LGGAVQYLGSRYSLGVWTSSVSALSAPWLLLPFAAGCWEQRPRRAALAGLAATLAGLAGYFALTLSPIEGVALNSFPAGLVAITRSNLPWLVGGALSGPLFGLLGHRWRRTRSWPGALAVAGAFVAEPPVHLLLARIAPAGVPWHAEPVHPIVAGVEIALGMLAVAHVVRERGAAARRLLPTVR
jgi:Family of unknown function (DUF6518)